MNTTSNNVILPLGYETKNLVFSDIYSLAHNYWQHAPEWYYKAAFDSIQKNRFEIIKGRKDDFVYLVRMWLTTPQMNKNGLGYESANDVMIHWFARPDDDTALHDHPWSFKTSILCGEYDEYLPPEEWLAGDRQLGPQWNARWVTRKPGDSASREATDLHCVGRVQRGTMTLMRTGPRERIWGFHEEGKPWVPFNEYLGQPREGCLIKTKMA